MIDRTSLSIDMRISDIFIRQSIFADGDEMTDMAHLVSRKATHNALLLFLDHASLLQCSFPLFKSLKVVKRWGK